MKKVFLSLAALAFVATSSLTMTSCGSDDDNGTETPVNPNNPDNPTNPDTPTNPTTQTDNTVVFDGVEYPLNVAIYDFLLQNYPTETEGETVPAPRLYQIDGEFYNGYIVTAAQFENGAFTTETFNLILVLNPTVEVEGTTITDFGDVILPHQAESIIVGNGGALIDGEEFVGSQTVQVDGEFVVNSFVVSTPTDVATTFTGTSSFTSVYTVGSDAFSVKFNGETLLREMNTSQSGRGVNSAKMNVLKSFEKYEVKNLRIAK